MSTPEAKPDSLAVSPKQENITVGKPEPQAGKLSRLAAFTPVNLTEAVALANLIAKSDLAPADFKNKPGNVLIAMQMGAEVGLAPMQAIQNIAVINGRPSLWGDAALGVVQTHPDYEWHKEGKDGTGATATAWFTIKRRGQEAHTTRFGVGDAQKAKLWGKAGPWQTYPDRMLQMRARGFGLRDKFADALRGLSIAEEAMDIPADTSDAKKEREKGTLDLSASLSPSSEPNRGHGDEGMQRTNTIQNSPQNEGGKQEAPKEDWICSDCGQTNSHTVECKHYGDWVKQAQDDKTSKPVKEVTVKIDKIDVQKKLDKKTNKRTGPPYRILHVTDADQLNWALYVWDTKFHKFIDDAGAGSMMICEFAENKQGDKTFCTLEHILNLKGVQFVNDAPAVSGEMPETQEREAGADDPENW